MNEVDRINQSTEYLDARGRELSWSLNNINHVPERVTQIKREIGSIAFELWFRHQSGEYTPSS